LHHVLECLELSENAERILTGSTMNGVRADRLLLEVQAILWFHGLVRTPGHKDNLTKTIDWTRILLSRLGAPREFILQVTNGITAIRSHQENSDDAAAQIAINIHRDVTGRY